MVDGVRVGSPANRKNGSTIKRVKSFRPSWAVMSLMYGKYPHPEPIERGMRLVMSRQRPDGSWAQEALEGMFNKTVTIAYPNFKMSFTIWMLGKAHHYLAEMRGEKSNGRANGHTEKNGHANGHAKTNGNGHTNGYANGNGH
ncbi:hypothetical protein QCA50_009168 [Cerrena zonata]|uniref:Squalene cyclase C-terminal domain-containing protein n=1 Tax=Cerrena zonata TaxID=2478898 RepID=A0AAW0G9C1_9APHY